MEQLPLKLKILPKGDLQQETEMLLIETEVEIIEEQTYKTILSFLKN